MYKFLSENHWKLDLLAALIFGIYSAYIIQVSADSGEKNIEKICWKVSIAIVSYLIACIIPIFLNNKTAKLTSWVWIGVVGSIVYAFNSMFLESFIWNWKYKESKSFIEYFIWLLPNSIKDFLFFSIVFTILTLFTIFLFRLPTIFFTARRNKLR